MFLGKAYNRWSIKLRLSVSVVLVSAAISYAVFEISHSTLHESLSQEENDFIYNRLHTLIAIIKEKPDYLETVKQDIDWEGTNIIFPYYYLRFVDQTGRVLIETPGMNTQVPVQWVPPPPSALNFQNKNVIRQAPNGRYFLLKADSVVPPYGPVKKLTMQIALDVTSEVKIDHEAHKKIFALVIAQAFIFSGVIILIIRKVIRPLDELVLISERISGRTISERTNPQDMPTEVKRLALSFNEMLDRLEHAFTRLSHSTSNMAHEFRTPLNNIMGEAEIALTKERPPEEYRNVLISVIEECQRLSCMISSLLFLAHADNHPDSINRSFFNPLEEIEDILSFYGPQIEEKGAEITFGGNGLLSGDRVLFQQAVSNLLVNALKYSPQGVKIDIAIRETDDRHTEVVVRDTGYGIQENDLVRIYDRFYRGTESSSNHPGGSGLGLSIVWAIMNLHGGSISVVSRPGEGTTFTLRFPLGDLLQGLGS